MCVSTTLPHLFGRFTAVIHGHADLVRTLQQLRAMCVALENGREIAADDALIPSDLVLRFRRELAEHFAVEEAEAYFGVVIDENPALEPQIEALKADHLTMLDAADVLCLLALDASRWASLSRPTRELTTRLERHERAESALLRELFGAKP
jgi:hypothetical protein